MFLFTGYIQARIRKTIKLNPDVKQISKEGTVAVCKATEFFVQHMAHLCYQGACHRRGAINKNRPSAGITVSSLKVDDLTHLVSHNAELRFLHADFPHTNAAEENKKRRRTAESAVPSSQV